MDSTGSDAQVRQAAFDHVNQLAVVRDGILDSADLAAGFEFGGQRIPLVNPYRGIFKPRQMAGLLSIRTVFPPRLARRYPIDVSGAAPLSRKPLENGRSKTAEPLAANLSLRYVQ